MSNGISLPILATEDDPFLKDQLILFFQQHFDLEVVPFEKNEDAWRSVNEVGDKYCAAVVDYYTCSAMEGGELIVRLANHGGCGEILALSSSTIRSNITEGIQRGLQQLQKSGQVLDQETLTRRISKIEIFDKASEGKLAELYLAAKILFPDESRGLTRRDFVSFVLGKPQEREEVARWQYETYLGNLNEIYFSIIGSRSISSNRQRLLAFVRETTSKTAEWRGNLGPERR